MCETSFPASCQISSVWRNATFSRISPIIYINILFLLFVRNIIQGQMFIENSADSFWWPMESVTANILSVTSSFSNLAGWVRHLYVPTFQCFDVYVPTSLCSKRKIVEKVILYVLCFSYSNWSFTDVTHLWKLCCCNLMSLQGKRYYYILYHYHYIMPKLIWMY